MSQLSHDVPETDVRESNPNGGGPQGLEGDLGISSERTGPAGADPATEGVQGTGSHGSAAGDARGATDGVMDTATSDPGQVPRVHPEDPAEGADPDEEQPEQERTASGEPSEGPDDPAHTSSSAPTSSGHHVNGDNTSILSGVDRTVGEPSPDPVANKHQFDPSKNPGH